jgi:hypothetical protein
VQDKKINLFVAELNALHCAAALALRYFRCRHIADILRLRSRVRFEEQNGY